MLCCCSLLLKRRCKSVALVRIRKTAAICCQRNALHKALTCVADKKDLAKKWAEALAAGAEKQQPLGGYRGEDVAAKNPFTKALAARGRLAVAS